jgi:hypothetical protein
MNEQIEIRKNYKRKKVRIFILSHQMKHKKSLNAHSSCNKEVKKRKGENERERKLFNMLILNYYLLLIIIMISENMKKILNYYFYYIKLCTIHTKSSL